MPEFAVQVLPTGAFLATHVRAARSLKARTQGLMGRAALAPGEGLWFPGDTGIHMFFMRIAIDAVFLAKTAEPDVWRVVAVRTLNPWRDIVLTVRGAFGCLEIAAGAAAAAGVVPGMTVRFVFARN